VLGAVIGGLLGAQVNHSLSGIEFSLAALFAVLAVEQWLATHQHWPIVAAIVSYIVACWYLPQQALTLAIVMSLLAGIIWVKKEKSIAGNISHD